MRAVRKRGGDDMKESETLERAHTGLAARVRKDWVLPISMAGLILGMLLALQFGTKRSAGEFGSLRRADLLAQMLASEQARVEDLQAEVTRARREKEEYAKAATKGKELLTLLNEENERYKLALGLAPVRGQGIIVQLEDSELVRTAGESAELFLIHDYDLWPLVNELRAAGAEAIAINNERVVGSTAIRCVGPVVNINRKGISPPYEIRAIGSARDLKGALEIKDGVLDRLRAAKFPVKLEVSQDVYIPAGVVSPEFKHVKAAKEPEKK